MREYGYGVDIGGTFTKFGRMDRQGNLLEKWSLPTDTSDGGRHLIASVGGSLRENLRKNGLSSEDLFGVGLGVPAPVDRDGWVVGGENTGWGHRRVDAAGELSDLLGVPVRAVNDGNAAALGEMWRGAGRGCPNLVMLTVGTALGGGVIVNGTIVTGCHGAGGEIGSMMMRPYEPEIAVDGKGGCLEQYVSATGLVRSAGKCLAADGRPSVLRAAAQLDAKAILDAAAGGDAIASEVLTDFADLLGQACACVSSVIDPELYLIGGGVSSAGELLLEPVRRAFHRYAYFVFGDTRFAIAALGNDAGIYGSCRLVLPE